MSRNVEIKAKVSDMSSLYERARSLATAGPVEIFQEDTFFLCQEGRLKLRKFADDRGELIFYRRSDQTGPKESFYLRSRTADPEILRESLALAYGVLGQVRKRRVLFLAGRTRIHLDEVDGLGQFIELEVVLADTDSVAGGEAEAVDLMAQLGIQTGELVEVAYIDLLQRQDV
ncbi:MAG: class IV adenylate cyclase [Burkholderiaceae bacterium]